MEVRICPECYFYESCIEWNRKSKGGCIMESNKLTRGDLSMYKGADRT